MPSEPDARTSLGLTIRELREQRALSQESLAAHVGIHRTYIGSVERGERNLGLMNLVRIAGALGVRPSELLKQAGL